MFDKEFEQACDIIFNNTDRVPPKNPKLSFIYASPGSGKTTTMKKLLTEEYPEGEKPIVVEVDEFRYFIPENVVGKEKKKISDQWHEKIVDRAIESGHNIILLNLKDLVFYNKANNTFKKAKEKGYNIEVNFLAVNKNISRMGVMHRYEHALKNMFEGGHVDHTNYPREPHFFNHYIFYKSLPIVATLCQKDKNVDSVRVFDRSGNLLSINNKKEKIKSKIGILKAVRNERNREMTSLEKEMYKKQMQAVKKLMVERDAPDYQKLLNASMMRQNLPSK